MIKKTREIFEKRRAHFSIAERLANRLPAVRGLSPDHPFAMAQRDSKLLLNTGRVVFGCVVEAEPNIFREGGDVCEASVVFSEDEIFDELPNLLAEIAVRVGALHDTPDLPPECAYILEYLLGNTKKKLNVLLPHSLSYNKEVYITSVYVFRPHLPAPFLRRGFFPLLVLPGQTDASMILPSHYWSDELTEEWMSE